MIVLDMKCTLKQYTNGFEDLMTDTNNCLYQVGVGPLNNSKYDFVSVPKLYWCFFQLDLIYFGNIIDGILPGFLGARQPKFQLWHLDNLSP